MSNSGVTAYTSTNEEFPDDYKMSDFRKESMIDGLEYELSELSGLGGEDIHIGNNVLG